MSVTKSANPAWSMVAAMSPLAKTLLGLGVVSVPALLGYAGYVNQRSRNNITKDKEFEADKRKLQMYTEAYNSLGNNE